MSLTDERAINNFLDRSEETLQTLTHTFGEDSPLVKKAFSRYLEATREADPYWCRLAATYLEWCKAKPLRIGGLPHTRECRCEWGFILDEDDENRYIPCPKCLPKAHDKWVGHEDEELDDDERPMI